jgi:hypothetical protein
MIISIGIDCGCAQWLKTHNLRQYAFPFDWCVTYNGVSKIIENDFNDYLQFQNDDIKFNNQGVSFVHNEGSDFYEKMQRRVDRFIYLLTNSTEKITFVRKGHACHNHNEVSNIKNDLDDARELDIILQKKYPKLQFEIIVILICEKCFDKDIVYIPEYKETTLNTTNVKIYNIVTPNSDYEKYDKICCDIFL